MTRPAGSCLVMLSGGLDSTVLLYDMLESGEQPVALTRATKQAELLAAQTITALTGVPHLILDSRQEVMGLLEAVTYERMTLEDHLGPNSFPHICSIADSITFASLLHIPRVLWGWRRSEMDQIEQPDGYLNFLAYISHLNALRRGPSIEAPYFEWSKQQVVQRGFDLAVPFEHTRSCLLDQAEPCSTCRRCLERQAVLP